MNIFAARFSFYTQIILIRIHFNNDTSNIQTICICLHIFSYNDGCTVLWNLHFSACLYFWWITRYFSTHSTFVKCCWSEIGDVIYCCCWRMDDTGHAVFSSSLGFKSNWVVDSVLFRCTWFQTVNKPVPSQCHTPIYKNIYTYKWTEFNFNISMKHFDVDAKRKIIKL